MLKLRRQDLLVDTPERVRNTTTFVALKMLLNALAISDISNLLIVSVHKSHGAVGRSARLLARENGRPSQTTIDVVRLDIADIALLLRNLIDAVHIIVQATFMLQKGPPFIVQ